MGAAMRAKGELSAAIKSYDRAIEINPKHVGARYKKLMLLLNLEDFKMGWPAYEYRRKKSKLDSVPVISSRPKWRLGDQGKVLVWGEQGIGDEIMFSYLIPDLHKACSQLIVKADKRLIPILRRYFQKILRFVKATHRFPKLITIPISLWARCHCIFDPISRVLKRRRKAIYLPMEKELRFCGTGF